MVFQKPNPFPKSIYNNVAWGARINGYRGDMDELVERSLRRAALWDEVKNKLNRSGLELSGGQQQRLCIARTLAVEPEVILMDEPCSALDPISTARVEDLMDDLKNDYTIVIVTHNMQQARRVSDMTACLMLDESSPDGHRTGNPRRVQPDRPSLHQPQRQAHRGLYHRAHRLSDAYPMRIPQPRIRGTKPTARRRIWTEWRRITDPIGFHELAASYIMLVFYSFIFYLSPLDSPLGFPTWHHQKSVGFAGA